MSKAEQILEALTELLRSVPGARAERNAAVPDRVPSVGALVVRDGDPGEPERVLGGFDQCEYSHAIPVEVYVQASSDSERDAAFDRLLAEIDQRLAGDRTLAGLAQGMLWSRPEAITEGIPAAAGIKAATLIVIVDYQTETPI